MKTALAQLTNTERPNYIVFLTDGLPTAGQTNEMKIAENAKKANSHGARIFAFGVGYDVNSRLIDRLVRDSSGQSEYVRPDEDIEERVSSLYRKIQSPVLTNVEIEFALDEHRSEYGKPHQPRLSQGPLRSVRRRAARGSGPLQTRRRGQGHCLRQGQRRRRPVRPLRSNSLPRWSRTAATTTHAFVEKLWAVRRVGEIIDELDLKGKNNELVKELVTLATKHGILTTLHFVHGRREHQPSTT